MRETIDLFRRTNIILGLSVGSMLFIISFILWRSRKIQESQLKQLETEMKQRFHLNAALNTEQNKLSTLLANWPDPIFVLDVHANIMDANPAAAHLMGFSKPELLLGKNEADLQPSELANEMLKEDQTILKTGKPLINKDVNLLNQTTGKWQQFLVTKAALHDQHEQIIGLAAIVRNITAQRQTEDALKLANLKLKDGITELELRTQEMDLLTQMIDLLIACQNMEEAYKIIEDQLGRLSLADSGILYVIKPSRNNLQQVAAWGQSVSETLVFMPSDCWGLRRGRLHTVQRYPVTRHDGHHANPLICPHISSSTPAEYLCLPLVAQGESLGILHLRHLIGTESVESEEIPETWFTPQRVQRINIIAESLALAIANLMLRTTLRQQSIRDPLTGLYNRRYLEETLERELLRASRSKKNVGLMIIDIDHFKQFNDTHGHPAADVVLSAVSHLFSTSVRREDLVCRYGGEEFVIMLPEAGLEITCQRAEAIRENVSQLRVQYQGQVLEPISISIGVGVFPNHGDIPEALISGVDQALYRAKHNGRNRVEVATPTHKNMTL
jgi:diguanylate cyclase (GGDEF)-like protein/PAS domain S-box-containing protein